MSQRTNQRSRSAIRVSGYSPTQNEMTTEINQSSANIMVVDDNRLNLILLERVLKDKGYDVCLIDDASQVIDTAEKVFPDLILLDFAMPVMDGYEVCKILKNNEMLRDIPVIFISAMSDTDDKVKALSVGAVDYVTKPFHDDEVLARIVTHLKIRNLQKQLEEKNTALEGEINRRREAEAELRIKAVTDPLTNIYNRRYFFELATKEFSRSRREGETFSIIMIDIDYFKNVNDSYGHLIGDQTLIRFSEICLANIREYDILARYGGEEFVILLPQTDADQALALAERLRDSVEKTPLEFGEIIVSITASFGISGSNKDMPLALDKILDRADQALYWSKKAGRNRISVWE
jgi:diguanylate cyclase (GGDEF)-like protein